MVMRGYNIGANPIYSYHSHIKTVEALYFLSGLQPDATNACDGQRPNVTFVASKLYMQLFIVL